MSHVLGMKFLAALGFEAGRKLGKLINLTLSKNIIENLD